MPPQTRSGREARGRAELASYAGAYGDLHGDDGGRDRKSRLLPSGYWLSSGGAADVSAVTTEDWRFREIASILPTVIGSVDDRGAGG